MGGGLPSVDSLHLTLSPQGVSGAAMRREVETGHFEGYRPTREPREGLHCHIQQRGIRGEKKEKKTQAAVCTSKNALMVLSVGYI